MLNGAAVHSSFEDDQIAHCVLVRLALSHALVVSVLWHLEVTIDEGARSHLGGPSAQTAL